MPLVERPEVPIRMAAMPRYGGQRKFVEAWDLSLRSDASEFWLSHSIIADASGRGLAELTGVFKRSPSEAARVIRTSAADPHLELAPVFAAGFEDARPRNVLAVDSRMNFASGRPGLAALGSELASGEGSASLGENHACGELSGRDARFEWDLSWPRGDYGLLAVPPGLWPMGAIQYQMLVLSPSPPMNGKLRIDGDEFDVAGVSGEFAHFWGCSYPREYAIVICGQWLTRSIDWEILGARGEGNSPGPCQLGIMWIRGGAWGRLGPPSPKTFAWMRVGSAVAAFNTFPEVLSASSHVKWPTWSARLIGRNLKLGIQITTDFDCLTQLERRDPLGTRVWRAFTTSARIEALIERKVGKTWAFAGSLTSESCRLEYGGYSPEHRVAVLA